MPDTLYTTTENHIYYFATQTFTKKTLPVGSYIELAEGWQYRPEGWVDEKTLTESGKRPVNVTTAKVVIDDAWWGDFTIRAFNIAKEGNNENIIGKEAEVREAFKIYVPNPNYKKK